MTGSQGTGKLTEAQRNEAAKIADEWADDLMAAGDQFDKDGDIYRSAGLARQIAIDIRAGFITGKPGNAGRAALKTGEK